MKLLVASFNPKKLIELKTILEPFLNAIKKQGATFEMVSLADFPNVKEVEEDGKTFEENAVKKALGYAEQTGLLTIAEDSGLSVDALAGAPGVYSARFAGEGKNDLDNCSKVIELVREIPEGKRTAQFESVVTVAEPNRVIGVAYGAVKGMVLTELRGENGFGYDPLFYYPPFKKTLAEVPPELKNTISHRRQALEKSQTIIAKYLTSITKQS